MDVAKMKIDQAEAARLYREYRDHRHSATPIDDEVERLRKAGARKRTK